MPQLRFLSANCLHDYPHLRQTMFQDRAKHFVQRHKWPSLNVDADGCEIDEYDNHSPCYVVWEMDDLTHGASLRLLPMTQKNMIFDHFSELVPRSANFGETTWECTRLVVSEKARKTGMTAMLLGINEVLRAVPDLEIFGVFDAAMLRVYRNINFSPIVIGEIYGDDGWLGLGKWCYSHGSYKSALNRLQVSEAHSQAWFDASSARWHDIVSIANRNPVLLSA